MHRCTIVVLGLLLAGCIEVTPEATPSPQKDPASNDTAPTPTPPLTQPPPEAKYAVVVTSAEEDAPIITPTEEELERAPAELLATLEAAAASGRGEKKTVSQETAANIRAWHDDVRRAHGVERGRTALAYGEGNFYVDIITGH